MTTKFLYFTLYCLFAFLFPFHTTYAQEFAIYRIGFLLDYQSPELGSGLDELKHEISTVVGADGEVVFPDKYFLVNDFDLDKAISNYSSLIKGDVDIILAFGNVSSTVITQQMQHDKPTILFGSVNEDITELAETDSVSGIENFTYLVNSHNYKTDLEQFKEITNFQNLGIAIHESYIEHLSLDNVFEGILEPLNSKFQLIPFTEVDDITSNLDDLDAFYLTGSRELSRGAIVRLADSLKSKQIPSFTATSLEDVKLGLMATHQVEETFEHFIRRVSLTVESVVNGRSLSTLPVAFEDDARLTINVSTAQVCDVPLKYSLIARTHLVGSLNNITAERVYTLRDIFIASSANNLSLQSDIRNIPLSQQDVQLAKSDYLPYINSSVNANHVDANRAIQGNPEFDINGNISLNQTIFSESVNSNIQINQQLNEAAIADYNAEELNIIFQSAQIYFSILLNKMNFRIQAQNLELTKSNLRLAELNYRSGQKSRSDMLRFRSQSAQNTQSFIEALNALHISYLQLNAFLNNDINMSIDVADAGIHDSLFQKYQYEELMEVVDNPLQRESLIEFITQEALINAPELASLSYQQAAVERNLQFLNNGRFLPQVDFQAQYIYDFTQWGEGSIDLDPKGSYLMGLKASLPIFSQNKYRINAQTSSIQLDQLKLGEKSAILNIKTNIRVNMLELINRMAAIELSKVSVTSAEENLKLLQVSYSEGAANIIQLIDAQNNYIQAQLSQANAEYQYLLAAIELERAMGYFMLIHPEDENRAFINRLKQYLIQNSDN